MFNTMSDTLASRLVGASEVAISRLQLGDCKISSGLTAERLNEGGYSALFQQEYKIIHSK